MSISPRLLIAGVAGFAVLLFAAEIGFRIVVGDRLLYRADPAYEYFPAPNQSVTRSGVRFETNALGMRSPDFTNDKPSGTLRVLVLGDSVVFGHTNISQPDLATTLLDGQSIGAAKIEALNISVPSWGPGNMLAWLEQNGDLGADKAIIVLSHDDLNDDRSFGPLDPDAYPQQQPVSALADWALRQLRGAAATRTARPGDARQALPTLFNRLAALPSGACVIVHAARSELAASEASATDIAKLAMAAGLTVISDGNYMNPASSYVDGIHLSADGQKRLAGAMTECLATASGT